MATNSYGWAQPNMNEFSTSMGMNRAGQTASLTGASPNAVGGGPTTAPAPGSLPGFGGYQTPSSNTDFLAAWYGMQGDVGKFGDKELRDQYGAWADDFVAPYLNAGLATQTQNFNEAQAMANFYEQQRINSGQMSLAEQAARREQQAMEFAQGTNSRDYTEAQRQFNEQLRGQNAYQQGQLGNQKFGLDTERQAVANQRAIQQEQNRIAQYEAATGRQDVEGRQRLEQYANQTARTGMQNQFTLGTQQNANERFGLQNEFTLGQGRNANERFGLQNQFTLGQGQLGFQNRELDTNEAFRQRQLGQEADLTREKFSNDLMQTRYNTFGRAVAPGQSAKVLRSWN